MARILVVDDSDEILQLCKLYLIDEGHTVVTVTDSLAAFEQLDKTKFDLMITDINMPHKSGLSFVSELRKTLRHRFIPIIFMSARNSKHDIMVATQAGGNDYIIKPIDKKVMLEKVNKQLKEVPTRGIDVALQPDKHNLEASLIYEKQVKLLNISDMGVKITTTFALKDKEVVQLKIPLLTEIGVTNKNFEVVHCEKAPEAKFHLTLAFRSFENQEEKVILEDWLKKMSK